MNDGDLRADDPIATELSAMRRIAAALDALTPVAQRRALGWVIGRYWQADAGTPPVETAYQEFLHGTPDSGS